MSDAFLDIWARSESADRDAIKVKRIYIDICGNLTDGVLFSQIMYWHGFNPETGKRRLQVFRDGHWWLAKKYEDWHEECRINASTARDGIKRMIDLGLLEKQLWHFKGKPMVHIRVVGEVFRAMVEQHMNVGESEQSSLTLRNPSNTIDGNRRMQSTESVDSYTETTPETTPETTKGVAPSSTDDTPPQERFGLTVGETLFWDHDSEYIPVTVREFTPKMVKVWVPVGEDKQRLATVYPHKLAREKPAESESGYTANDVINAWLEGMPIKPIKVNYGKLGTTAKLILREGYTPDQVRRCVEYKHRRGRTTKYQIHYLLEDLPLWSSLGEPTNERSPINRTATGTGRQAGNGGGFARTTPRQNGTPGGENAAGAERTAAFKRRQQERERVQDVSHGSAPESAGTSGDLAPTGTDG